LQACSFVAGVGVGDTTCSYDFYFGFYMRSLRSALFCAHSVDNSSVEMETLLIQ
jgi:hypothetical protein